MDTFLDLPDIFSLVNQLRYFATKIDTPFFTDKFPKEYPVGRDVDIICHPEDFKKFIQVCEEKIKAPVNYSRHIVEDNISHFRFRVHAAEYFMRPNPCPYDKLVFGLPMTKLHFQVDVSTTEELDYAVFSEEFLSSIFENLEELNGVKILSKEKESALRLLFWKKSPRAIHHMEYVLQNGSKSIVDSFKDGEYKESCLEILDKLFGENSV